MTQNEKILGYLRTHPQGITQAQAYDLFGCLRLSGRIWDLRHMGYSIKSETVAVKNRFNEPCYVAQYSLME